MEKFHGLHRGYFLAEFRSSQSLTGVAYACGKCNTTIVEIVATDGEATTRILAAAEWAYDEGMSWPKILEMRLSLAPPFDSSVVSV